MRLVVDTNVLMTFFWKDSVFERVSRLDVRLSSPEYALKEINSHAAEIMKKTKITKADFRKRLAELAEKVEFIPLAEYSSFFKEGKSLSKDEGFLKDIDFYALAFKLRCPVWTNDRQYREQNRILIFSTEDLITLLG